MPRPSAREEPQGLDETAPASEGYGLLPPEGEAPRRHVVFDDEPAWPQQRPKKNIVVRTIRFLVTAVLTLLGVPTLILGLAIAATIPIVQFLSLGYLLEVSGRIARGGKISSGFIGLKPAGIAGTFLAFMGLVWLGLRFVSAMAINAEIIAPGSGVAGAWGLGAFIGMAVLVVVLGILTGVVSLIRPGTYGELRDELWRIVTNRMPSYFWLGLRGFLGGVIWLAIPITMLVAAAMLPNPERPGMVALGAGLRIVGAILLMTVVLALPFLQARMAAENRFGEMFAWRTIREHFRRAPLAFGFAATITLLFALPLYLLKIEFVPTDVAWLPSVVFVTFIFPARFLAGWAYARSQRRQSRGHWTFRWLARLGMVAVAAFYVLIVFASQYTGWHGVWGLYEQHAFLLPVPFLGM